MASYFDEHNCEPLKDGQSPDHLLHLARCLYLPIEIRVYTIKRLLLDGGYARDMDMEFSRIFGGERKPPPASKKVVQELPTLNTTALQGAQVLKCPVCLAEFEEGEEMKKMPCSHLFHPKCILPWLSKTNSCPLCRFELPTDDPDYEQYKKDKAREKQRQFEMESLHNSMFG